MRDIQIGARMERQHIPESPLKEANTTDPNAGNAAMVDQLAQLRDQTTDLQSLNQQLSDDNQRLEADLTRLAEHAALLYEENRRDPMTGLLNKKGFEEQLEALMTHDKPFVVFMADLMSLKAINDTLGHAAGDAAIANTANVLRFGMTILDTMTLIGLDGEPATARLGGDEYAVAVSLDGLNQFTSNQTDAIDEALRELDEDPTAQSLYSRELLEKAKAGELTHEDAAQMIYVAVESLYDGYLESNGGPDLGQGIAMGWAIHDPKNSEDQTPEELLKKADESMYVDKKKKRDTLGSYDRRTKTRIGPDRRGQQGDRRSGEDRRDGMPDRRGTVALGTFALRDPRPIVPPSPM